MRFCRLACLAMDTRSPFAANSCSSLGLRLIHTITPAVNDKSESGTGSKAYEVSYGGTSEIFDKPFPLYVVNLALLIAASVVEDDFDVIGVSEKKRVVDDKVEPRTGSADYKRDSATALSRMAHFLRPPLSRIVFPLGPYRAASQQAGPSRTTQSRR